MERKQLMRYLPPVLQNVFEFRWIMAAEQKQFDHLHQCLESVMDNQFYDDLDEIGLVRHEKILGITPKATNTQEDRRFRIKSRYNEQLPFTLRTLERQLTALCGADGYTVSVDTDGYLLVVKVALGAKERFNDVKEMLERVAPANLILQVEQLYNPWYAVTGFTWGQAKAMTWREIREEVLPDG